MKEYKPIPGWEKYGVSTDGEVKNLKTGKILKPYLTRYGYLQVVLSNVKPITIRIHQLMAMTYLEHIPNGHEKVVDHINGNKLENKLENLRLLSNRDNVNLSRKTGKRKGKGTSQYLGVAWNKRNNKWRAMIDLNGKRKCLGYFEIEKEAHQAYQTALRNHLSQGGDI